MVTSVQRIHGRLVEIEVGEVRGVGWVAVAVVKQGLAHEVGMRLEAREADAARAEALLLSQLEAQFG